MEGILNKIQKITCKITQKKSKVDKLKKIVMATTYQEELQEIRTLMDSLHKQSQWLILVRAASISTLRDYSLIDLFELQNIRYSHK